MVNDRRSDSSGRWLLQWPVLWGMAACGAFYALVLAGPLSHPLIESLFADHPVEYVATAMFFLGMATLAVKQIQIARQRRLADAELFGRLPDQRWTLSDAAALAERLDRLAGGLRHSYLVNRLIDALRFVHRSGTASQLDDELDDLADGATQRAEADYGIVRMFVWAIPILGFLGTVIGIAMAMGKLAPQDLEESLPEVMASLTVAFNTTILALGLCIVLFFAQFFTQRREEKLLDLIDQRARELLLGRFGATRSIEAAPGGAGAMVEAIEQAGRRMIEQQTEIWQQAVERLEVRSAEIALAAARQLQEALDQAMRSSLAEHANRLAEAEQRAAELSRRYWEEAAKAVDQQASALAASAAQLARQLEVWNRTAQVTQWIAQLQELLNRNLASLAATGHFEQAMAGLSAAIQLLNARLGQTASPVSLVDFSGGGKAHGGRAARNPAAVASDDPSQNPSQAA